MAVLSSCRDNYGDGGDKWLLSRYNLAGHEGFQIVTFLRESFIMSKIIFLYAIAEILSPEIRNGSQ
jgi:hypothetical protein